MTSVKAKRKRKTKTPGLVKIHLDGCKYDVLRRVATTRLQWTIATGEDQPFHLLWSDCSVTSERVMKLVTGQVCDFTLEAGAYGAAS